MNKLELINALRFEAEITKSEAAAVINLFFNEMANALAERGPGSKSGDCGLKMTKKYKAYTGRNPITGKGVKVKAKKLPYFKPGVKLKERVDNK